MFTFTNIYSEIYNICISESKYIYLWGGYVGNILKIRRKKPKTNKGLSIIPRI